MGSIVDAKNVEGHQGSLKVKWGKHWCMDMKLGGWGQLLVPTILMVTSRSSRAIQGQMRLNGIKVYGHETWWVGSIVDAENFEGNFKVIRGHPRSNG